jgi:hypothetical protein
MRSSDSKRPHIALDNKKLRRIGIVSLVGYVRQRLAPSVPVAGSTATAHTLPFDDPKKTKREAVG